MKFIHPDLPDVEMNVDYDAETQQLTLTGVDLETAQPRFHVGLFAGVLEEPPAPVILELEEATEPIYAEAEEAAAQIAAAESDTATSENTPTDE